MGIDVDGSGTGRCVAAVSLSIGDITVTLPAATQLSQLASCCLGQLPHRHYTDCYTQLH